MPAALTKRKEMRMASNVGKRKYRLLILTPSSGSYSLRFAIKLKTENPICSVKSYSHLYILSEIL